jgi:hypothetical protein
MFEQILDRFARLEESVRRWQVISLALAALLVVSTAVGGILILRLRVLLEVETARAQKLEMVAEQAEREAAVAREREVQARHGLEARADPCGPRR